MSNACPLPGPKSSSERDVIARLVQAKRIAIVGLSDDPSRASFGVAEYLISVGKEIIPVNPSVDEVLGIKAVASLSKIKGPVDLVNVFRRPEYCANVAREAVAIGAKGIWLQSGISSPEARRIAAEAGMDYVESRCLMVEHRIHG